MVAIVTTKISRNEERRLDDVIVCLSRCDYHTHELLGESCQGMSKVWCSSEKEASIRLRGGSPGVIVLEDEDDDDETKPARSNTADDRRGARYRSSCPHSIMDRIQRALVQRLYLVEKGDIDRDNRSCSLVVMGSTGNLYTVTLRDKASCTCPDHERSYLCKHILFVLLKVAGVSSDSDIVYQEAWTNRELDELLELLSSRRVGGSSGVLANDRVRERYAQLQKGADGVIEGDDDEESGVIRKSLDDDSDCPICFDAMDASKEKLVHCRVMCGANFHDSCIQKWSSSASSGRLTCPNCRTPWETTKKREAEGYTNLGDLQGQLSSRSYRRRYY